MTPDFLNCSLNVLGTIIASGSTENVIRCWDPRTCNRLIKLKGHTENIKSLVISTDGSHILSGSSDGTIKLWSVGQQRCIQTISIHTEGVWSLLVNENFTHVISGSRDKKIFQTEIRNPYNSVLVCEEKAPVLNMCYNLDHTGIWTTTWNSDIKQWKLPKMNADKSSSSQQNSSNLSLNEQQAVAPFNTVEEKCIKGGNAIEKYAVLNDKRFMVTRDTDQNVGIYDVLKVSKVESLGKIDFDETVKARNKMVHVPNWFTVDLKTGVSVEKCHRMFWSLIFKFLLQMPTIVLGQDEIDCFAAWVSATEAGLGTGHAENGSDPKVNYGSLLLQALLEYWSQPIADMDNDIRGNEYFKVPKHTPILFRLVVLPLTTYHCI